MEQVRKACALRKAWCHVCERGSYRSVLLQVDLQYLSEILRDGADANSADKYGQTVLHEVSCSALQHQMLWDMGLTDEETCAVGLASLPKDNCEYSLSLQKKATCDCVNRVITCEKTFAMLNYKCVLVDLSSLECRCDEVLPGKRS